MDSRDNKPYEKVIDYVEEQILDRKLKTGDRIPPERELSAMLQISRGAVREGMNVLEAIGLVSNIHGSGNYVASHFDDTLAKLMAMMYTLDEMSFDEIREFRYSAERQAILLACGHIPEDKEKELYYNLEVMENSADRDEQTASDMRIHYIIAEASGNRLVIANFMALTRIMHQFVKSARNNVQYRQPDRFQDFQNTHRRLVEAVCSGHYEAAEKALDDHFIYIKGNIET